MYVLEEARLRKNLETIAHVAKEADVEIILAFKAYALWRTFPIFREYIKATTASSLFEARLGFEEFGAPTHTFSPGYTDYELTISLVVHRILSSTQSLNTSVITFERRW